VQANTSVPKDVVVRNILTFWRDRW